jgi:hypothetical protein
VRRVSSLGILLLVGVLSGSHYKISLLPSARQQDPRPSRAEAPVQSASSSLKAAGLVARTAIESDCGMSDVPIALPIVLKYAPGPESTLDPVYLQPHFFRALGSDLPPPSLLAPRS